MSNPDNEKGLFFSSTRKYPSPEMLNIKCLIVGTGDQINNINPSDLELGMCASVTDDASDLSLRAGVVYLWTLTGWVSLNAGTHTHSGANDGGLMSNVMVKGFRNVWYRNFEDPFNFKNILTQVNGTATMQSTGYLELMANSGTANNYINAHTRGLIYTFTQPLSFFARLKLTDVATNYLSRFGFNPETVEDPSLDNEPKMMLEGCDTCNTNKVTIVSANNVNREKDPTPITNLTTDLANYSLELIPTETKIIYNRNDSTFVIKDEFIPTTGVPTRTRQFIAGIQTKNTTAKKMEIYGFSAYGTIGETNWVTLREAP